MMKIVFRFFLGFLCLLFVQCRTFNYQQDRRLAARRRRELNPAKDAAQHLLNMAFSDQKELQDKVEEAMENDRRTMREVTQNILQASRSMAEVGASRFGSLSEWNRVESELRRGLNVIIDGYQRYKDLNRRICEDVDRFVETIVSRYRSELFTLGQMTPPVDRQPFGVMDSDSPEWRRFTDKYNHMLRYANLHEKTLPYAMDCVNDLIRNTINNQQTIFYPPPSPQTTITVHTVVSDVAPAVVAQPVSVITLNCGGLSDYNGNQVCANDLALASQNQANLACQCVVSK